MPRDRRRARRRPVPPPKKRSTPTTPTDSETRCRHGAGFSGERDTLEDPCRGIGGEQGVGRSRLQRSDRHRRRRRIAKPDVVRVPGSAVNEPPWRTHAEGSEESKASAGPASKEAIDTDDADG